MKIVVISDLDVRGSGYRNITLPLCDGLTELGHEIKALGLGYKGEEHHNKFSIIPAQNFNEISAMVHNLKNLWDFDVLMVLLDIPLQEQIMARFQGRDFKYVGVMPIEADPLCMTWAMTLMNMDKAFIISQFGTDEAQKMGVFHAEHIRIGVDTDAWRQPTKEEQSKLRKALGYSDEDFIVLTVADNQERKNLSRSMEIISDVYEDHENIRYVLVTREHNLVGWKIRDYAQLMGINKILSIYERGVSFEQLWSLYAIADAFLLNSKAEGLGMPLLEAQAVGVPCIGTDCTAIAELLSDSRGYMIDHDYIYVDPFGNGKRYFASRKHGASILNQLVISDKPTTIINSARKWVEERKWEEPVNQLHEALLKLLES